MRLQLLRLLGSRLQTRSWSAWRQTSPTRADTPRLSNRIDKLELRRRTEAQVRDLFAVAEVEESLVKDIVEARRAIWAGTSIGEPLSSSLLYPIVLRRLTSTTKSHTDNPY